MEKSSLEEYPLHSFPRFLKSIPVSCLHHCGNHALQWPPKHNDQSSFCSPSARDQFITPSILKHFFSPFTSKIPNVLSWFYDYQPLFCWLLFHFPTFKRAPHNPSLGLIFCSLTLLHLFHVVPRHWITSVQSLLFQLWSLSDLCIGFYLTFS